MKSRTPEGYRTSGGTASAALRVLVPGASLLFLASAAASVWAAYDRGPAYLALGALACGLLLAAAAVAGAGRHGSGTALLGFAALAAAAALGLLGLSQGTASGSPAGSIALLIPLGVAAAVWCYEAGYRVASLSCLGLVLLCTALLALGGERAPVAALVAGGALALIAMELIRPRAGWARRLLLVAATAGLLGLGAFYLALVDQPGRAPAPIAQALPSLIERFARWNESLPLVADYAFTGSGLANTAMVHASYLLLSHVPFLQHVHNLPLQIAIEQGVFGLLAFVTLLGSAFFAAGLLLRRSKMLHRRMAAAVLASLFTLLLLGLLDSELSLTPFQIALFAPPAAAWSLHRSVEGGRNLAPRQEWAGSATAAALLALLVTVPLLLLGPASLQTNLTAVLQQQIELSVYDQPTWSFQDRVRREHVAALAPVIAGYERALASDAAFAPAHRRLGQIHLSLGNPETALTHLQAAAASEQSLPTLLLLGEATALTGDPQRAAALWRGIRLEQDQIWLRWAWHESIGDTERAHRIEEAARAISLRVVPPWDLHFWDVAQRWR